MPRSPVVKLPAVNPETGRRIQQVLNMDRELELGYRSTVNCEECAYLLRYSVGGPGAIRSWSRG